jgi:hypothetical protein
MLWRTVPASCRHAPLAPPNKHLLLLRCGGFRLNILPC